MLGGVVAVVVAGIAVMAALGYYAFIWKTAIVPALVVAALMSRRLERFVADWSVFLALVLLFDFLRGLVFALITNFGLPVYMQYAIEWERKLSGGVVIPVVLQEWRAASEYAPLFDRLFTLVHASHFAFFLLFGLAIWLLRPDEFRRYATALVLVIYVGLLFYLVVPTVPPWMAAERFGLLPPLEHVVSGIYNSELPSLQKAFDVNPIAAMPSLHAALPILCALFACSHFGWWALCTVTYAALAVFGILYLGEHYFVDVVAGGLVSIVVFVAVHSRWPSALAWPRQLATMPPALAAAVLVVFAEGAGLLTFRLVKPFEITQAFAERELAGRTPIAHFHLGRLALDRGDLPRARAEFERAVATSESPVQRRYAAALLTRTTDQEAGSGVSHAGGVPVPHGE